MSAYLSSFLTTTTTKYNSIRRALISSDADGDTEDESHICRALRSYYTEKGRQFPEWLPPDPNAPPVPQPVTFNTAAGGQQMQGGGGYGQQQQPLRGPGLPTGPKGGGAPQRWAAGRGSGGSGGGLSDLWGEGGGQQQQQQQQNDSLRPSRFGGQQQTSPQKGAGGGRLGDLYGDQGARPQAGGRMGSYQNSRMQDTASPAPSAGSGASAKDMLKQKLWGSGRTTSPTPGATGGSGVSYGGGNSYDSQSGRPQYGGQQSSYGGGGNDGYGGRQNQGSSWGGGQPQAPAPARGYGSSNPYGNNSGGGGGGGGGGGNRMGLPSGPRPRRG